MKSITLAEAKTRLLASLVLEEIVKNPEVPSTPELINILRSVTTVDEKIDVKMENIRKCLAAYMKRLWELEDFSVALKTTKCKTAFYSDYSSNLPVKIKGFFLNDAFYDECGRKYQTGSNETEVPQYMASRGNLAMTTGLIFENIVDAHKWPIRLMSKWIHAGEIAAKDGEGLLKKAEQNYTRYLTKHEKTATPKEPTIKVGNVNLTFTDATTNTVYTTATQSTRFRFTSGGPRADPARLENIYSELTRNTDADLA
jgi:hypothetical protein